MSEACGARRSCTSAGVAVFLFAAAMALAAVDRYALELPAGRSVDFKIELPVEHPGRLSILAEWSGRRVLSLRLQGPGSISARRSGPSPQALEIEVPPSLAGGPWRLSIHGLPSRESSQCTLQVELVEPKATVAREPVEVAPRSVERDPWAQPRATPPALSPRAARLHDDLERFRMLVVPDGSMTPDTCHWQQGFLRQLWKWTGAVEQNPSQALLQEETHRILRELVRIVQQVEELRVSKDPVLAGPVPQDPLRRRAWNALRQERIRPLVAQLDVLTSALRQAPAPELDEESWPSRLIGCVTACERHFEERARLGQRRASNSELAAEQWERILAAARVLESLLDAEPPAAD